MRGQDNFFIVTPKLVPISPKQALPQVESYGMESVESGEYKKREPEPESGKSVNLFAQ